MSIEGTSSVKLFIDNSSKGMQNQLTKQTFLEQLMHDLSNLLNTKPSYLTRIDGEEGFIINYGLIGLSQFSPYSQGDQKKVADLIEKCISDFEPRLEKVSVTRLNPENNYSVSFNYKINATINLGYEIMPVEIESKIDSSLQEISINLARAENA